MYRGPTFFINNGYLSTTGYDGQTGTVYNRRSGKMQSTFSSVKTPGFWMMKKRNIPHNPFSHTFESWTGGKYIRGTFQMSGGIVYSTLLSGNIDTLSAIRPWLKLPLGIDVEKDCRSKILDKLKSQSVNLAQSYAERKQTTNMIAKSVNRLASAAMAVRRGNFRHASELFGMRHPSSKLKREIKPHPDNLANHWLEFQYGWKPLLSEIYGAAELLAKTYELERPTVVKATKIREFSELKYPGAYFYQGLHVAECLVDSKGSSRCTYVIEFIEDDAHIARMSSTGIANPLLLAWELLPYSFVIDWFLPVGNYLGNLDATTGLSFLRGSKTIVLHSTHTSRWRTLVVGSAPEIRTYGQGDSHEIYSKNRTVLQSFPSPPPPTFEPSLGVTRALSGMALLTQLFSRKR